MRLSFILICLVLFNPFLTAQWNFQGNFPTEIETDRGVRAISVDPDRKVWIAPYATSDDSLYVPDSSKYLPVHALYCFNTDGTPATFSDPGIVYDTATGKIFAVTVNGTLRPFYHTKNAARCDNDGHIVIADSTAMFRINYQTGAVMDYKTFADIIPGFDFVPTNIAFDNAGNIYAANTYPLPQMPPQSPPALVLSPDFSFLAVPMDTLSGHGSTIEVSGDGHTIYIPRYDEGGLRIYSRPDEFSPYVLSAIVLPEIHCDAAAFDSRGLLWLSAGAYQYPPGGLFSAGSYYAFDTETWEIKDTIAWHQSDPPNPGIKNSSIAFDYSTAINPQVLAYLSISGSGSIINPVQKFESDYYYEQYLYVYPGSTSVDSLIDANVPVRITTPSQPISSFSAVLEFDSSIISNVGISLDSTICGENGWTVTAVENDSGHVEITGSGTTAITNSGRLLNLVCTGTDYGKSKLTFVEFVWNSGLPNAFCLEGSVEYLLPLRYISGVVSNTIIGGVDSVKMYYGTDSSEFVLTNDMGEYSVPVNLYYSGTIQPQKEGFAFQPEYRTYTDVQDNITGEDYEALAEFIHVSFPDTSVAEDSLIAVPITVGDVTGRSITQFEAMIEFDYEEIAYIEPVIEGCLINNDWDLTVVQMPSKKVFIHAETENDTLAGSGALLKLLFRAIDSSGTTLDFLSFQFNEGIPVAFTQNGTISIITAIDDESGTIPVEYQLSQNYPNPFNPSTTIKFGLPQAGNVEVVIFNQLGQRVETLVSQEMQAGYHELEWNAAAYSSGVYFYSITSGNFKAVKKMLLLK